MSIFANKYRIVTDRYLGYEAQVRKWWLPWWIQLGYCNTFSSVEEAKKYINTYKRVIWSSSDEES